MAQPRRSVGRRRNLLVEIGTEELPPKALRALSESFAASLYRGLVEAGVVEDAPGRLKNYATPRRLAVTIRTFAYPSMRTRGLLAAFSQRVVAPGAACP